MSEPARLSSLSAPLQQWLLSQLRGDAAPFPPNPSQADLKRFLRFTADAGIQPYLRYRLGEACPPALAEALTSRALMERIESRRRADELVRVLAAFDPAGIRSLVLKGSALTHLVYPAPGLRPACDIDLLVDSRDKGRAEAALLSLGYRRVTAYNFEAQYSRWEGGLEHLLDLHWRLSDSPFLSLLFEFDELFDRSIAIPGLDAPARGLNLIDSLLNACVHLASHREWERLIWLLDIDLLSRRLRGGGEFDAFVDRAIEKQCASICLEALTRAREAFGADLPLASMTRLAHRREASAYLLLLERDAYREFLQLLRVSPWRQRLRLAWLALFPPLQLIHPDHNRGGCANVIYLRRLLALPGRGFGYVRKMRRQGDPDEG